MSSRDLPKYQCGIRRYPQNCVKVFCSGWCLRLTPREAEKPENAPKSGQSFQHCGEKIKVFRRERFRCTEEKGFLFLDQVERALGHARSDWRRAMNQLRCKGFPDRHGGGAGLPYVGQEGSACERVIGKNATRNLLWWRSLYSCGDSGRIATAPLPQPVELKPLETEGALKRRHIFAYERSLERLSIQ